MANTSIQMGISPRHGVGNFQRAQYEIDACVKKGRDTAFELVNEFSRHGNTYAIDLDSVADSVTEEDVSFTRIYPHRDVSKKGLTLGIDTSKFSTTELETKLVAVAKKLFEASIVVMNVLVAFLMKLDVLCELVLTKGNAYVQSVSRAVSERHALHQQQAREQALQRVQEQARQQVVRQVREEEPVITQALPQPTVVPVQSYASIQRVPVQYQAVRQYQEQAVSEQIEVKNVVKTRFYTPFVYSFILLYRELLYGNGITKKN